MSRVAALWGILWCIGTVLVALAVMIPIRTNGLGSHARPAASYAEAVNRAAQEDIREESITVPNGRSILLVHGARTPRAVVLVHGLTNSPHQFKAFAEQLYGDGDNVYVPRLPFHALRAGGVGDLAGLTAEHLRDFGDAAIDVAHGLGDTIVVAGLSVGGLVAAWSGQYRADVARVVVVAPLFEIARVPSWLEEALMDLALRMPSLTYGGRADAAQPDRELGWSAHAVAQALRLGFAVRRAAERSPPTAREAVFLLNAHDRTVKAGPPLDLARRWAAAGCSTAVFELPDSLRLPHDVVDPRQPLGNPSVVYPVLRALIRGRPPSLGVRVLPDGAARGQ